MGIRENKVETYLHEEVIKLGGHTEKWGTQGNADRVVFLQGIIYVVEIKTLDGTLTVLQKRKFPKIEKTGVKVHILVSYEEVDEFIGFLKGRVCF